MSFASYVARASVVGTAAFLSAVATLPAAASTITYFGALTDGAAGWRTPSATTAPFALSPSGVLGVDGYYLPGGQGVSAQPGYISSFAGNPAVYPGNNGYLSIDNPTTTPGATPTQLTTGTFNPFPGTGQPADTFAFTLAARAPARIRVGVLVDNLDSPIFNPSAVSIASSGIGTSPIVPLTAAGFNNRAADFVYFDIAGGVAGETFYVTTYGGNAGCACNGGVSFDSATVPEPGVWLLMIGGFGLVGTALRRRSTTLA